MGSKKKKHKKFHGHKIVHILKQIHNLNNLL